MPVLGPGVHSILFHVFVSVWIMCWSQTDKLWAETKKLTTIVVDVTYTVFAHGISPDRRIRANSCIEISKYMSLSLRGTCINVDRSIAKWWSLDSSSNDSVGAYVLMKVAYREEVLGLSDVQRSLPQFQVVSEAVWCEWQTRHREFAGSSFQKKVWPLAITFSEPSSASLVSLNASMSML